MALWYIRAYLWFVLLAPLLWWAFRRRPILTVLAPLAGALVMYSMLPMSGNRVADVLWSTLAYGTCWMLGYARYTGLLDRLPMRGCLCLAAGLGGAGLLWASLRTGGLPVTEPFADVLWGTAFTLVLMRLRPDVSWVDRWRWLSRAVTVVNARAVTIYIWHLPMLFAAGALIALVGLDWRDRVGGFVAIAVGTALTCLAVLCLGWIEDLAARRRPALLPVR
jgi:peptidoglycan/LPS O-acetylase OafA/YrhL